MRCGAVRIGAAPDMAGFGADCRMAADAADGSLDRGGKAIVVIGPWALTQASS